MKYQLNIYTLENVALGHTKSFEKNCKNITFDTSCDGSVALEENTGFVFSLVRGLWLVGAILKFPQKRGFWIKNSCQIRFFSNIRLKVL